MNVRGDLLRSLHSTNTTALMFKSTLSTAKGAAIV